MNDVKVRVKTQSPLLRWLSPPVGGGAGSALLFLWQVRGFLKGPRKTEQTTVFIIKHSFLHLSGIDFAFELSNNKCSL